MDKIKELFDYQRFSGHKGLSEMVSDTAERYGIASKGGIELSDDDLMLNAAGEGEIPKNKDD